MEALAQLKQYYEQGFMSKEDYDKKRLEIIDAVQRGVKPAVGKTGPKPAPAPLAADPFSPQPDNLAPDPFTQVAPPTAVQVAAPAPAAAAPSAGPGAPAQPKSSKVIPGQPPPGAKTKVTAQQEEEYKQLGWQLFYAASVNDVARLKDLLDRGADPNCRDAETDATPCYVASTRAQKHAVYYLVERGANPNAQNNKGNTPLHECVKHKQNEMCLWIIKHGADPFIENHQGYNCFDGALPWLVKEMKDERDAYNREMKKKELAAAKAAAAQAAPPGPDSPQLQPTAAVYAEPSLTSSSAHGLGHTPVFQPRVISQEVMKIFMKNGSYKSVVVTSEDTAKTLADNVADKLNMAKYANYFDVIEIVRGQEKRLDANQNIMACKKKWPTIIGASGSNETETQCKFVCVPKRGTPENITMMYRDAIYGGRA